MKIAIKDANVLIDLAVAGLLESWFQLGIATCTTDLVFQQVKHEPQAVAVLPFVESGMLEIVAFDGEKMEACARKFSDRRFGIEDASVISLALQREAILLSGDRAVVKTARLAGVEVHGLLWVFDQLVARSVLPPRLATIKLRAVVAHGTYLPNDECERRFKEWNEA
jgi:predicted nucleic acid-binding protein